MRLRALRLDSLAIFSKRHRLLGVVESLLGKLKCLGLLQGDILAVMLDRDGGFILWLVLDFLFLALFLLLLFLLLSFLAFLLASFLLDLLQLLALATHGIQQLHAAQKAALES